MLISNGKSDEVDSIFACGRPKHQAAICVRICISIVLLVCFAGCQATPKTMSSIENETEAEKDLFQVGEDTGLMIESRLRRDGVWQLDIENKGSSHVTLAHPLSSVGWGTWVIFADIGARLGMPIRPDPTIDFTVADYPQTIEIPSGKIVQVDLPLLDYDWFIPKAMRLTTPLDPKRTPVKGWVEVSPVDGHWLDGKPTPKAPFAFRCQVLPFYYY